MSNPDEPAFARSSDWGSDQQKGLTKREYFAAMALSGISSAINRYPTENLALAAVELADATLAELGKGES